METRERQKKKKKVLEYEEGNTRKKKKEKLGVGMINSEGHIDEREFHLKTINSTKEVIDVKSMNNLAVILLPTADQVYQFLHLHIVDYIYIYVNY